MGRKRLSLRRSDTCAMCSRTLCIGEPAEWDSVERSVTCVPCAEVHTESAPPADPSPPPVMDTGRPGASARAEYVRRHEKREQQLEVKWGTGRIGRLAKAFSDDPQSTKAWAKGSSMPSVIAERSSAETLAAYSGRMCGSSLAVVIGRSSSTVSGGRSMRSEAHSETIRPFRSMHA